MGSGIIPPRRKFLSLLTARELEAMLKINVKTIYSYVQRGLMPYVRVQSNVRFPRQAILHWIEEQSYRPGAIHGGDPTLPSTRKLTLT
ncbi:MAG: helix-turn-helix domain-containing protein [Terriglobia bacterium]